MVLRILVAVLIGAAIAFVGFRVLRSLTGGSAGAARRSREPGTEPEDVADLDVYFVCRECGTEFQVTRLGEIQVPRHCGEPMEVVRRPVSGGSALN